MSERVTEEDCFNVYWNGEGEMPSHLCAADFARELSLARARVKELQEELEKSKHAFNPYPGRVLRGEEER
jgi:hypothetical protein